MSVIFDALNDPMMRVRANLVALYTLRDRSAVLCPF